MKDGKVEAIGIAAEHEAPMTRVEQVHALAGKGLEGDRNFGRGEPGREVTLIEAEAIDTLAEETGVRLEYQDARRNIITRGVALTELLDKEFSVGDVRIRGVKLSEPCQHLASLTDQKVLKGLVHRGGLSCQILSDGVIRVGDAVSVGDPVST